MRKVFFLMILPGILFLASCSSGEEASESEASDSTDIKELVHEYSTGTFDEHIAATITWNEMIVTNEEKGEEETFELPEDQFFISIAPFEKVTHPCFDHSLTGCQGELVHETFDVEILDSEGEVVVAEPMETMENGFIDLWLPRNDEYKVTITKDGKAAKATLSTFEGDQTCVTTMQLEEV